jgi:[ribosomal protein S5]-alanine N-acetyltransferase
MVRLVRAELPLLDAALAGDEALARALGHAVVPGWATFAGALRIERATVAARSSGARWGPRLFVAGDPPELVGWGGFKGPPRSGRVELGYEIAASRRGRGLATSAARAMVAEAFADGRVTRVIAHTLPEPNASTRVLENAGFRFERAVRQGDATVWRFAIDRSEDDARTAP